MYGEDQSNDAAEARPSWAIECAEAVDQTPYEGDARADLAIIGGGITGLSTALHAAERGLACHVLEAGTVGEGASGRNVGLVNAGLWLPPQIVMERLGEQRGAALLATLSEAPEAVFSLIERFQIRCEARRKGTIHAAHNARGVADLTHRHNGWLQFGAPVTLLSKEEMRERVGSDAFHGGLFDPRAGTINPLGYVRGLARAARQAGALVSTHTRATALSREGADWIVQTPRGSLKARHVVLATNAYTDAIAKKLGRAFTEISYVQIATVPLADRIATFLPGEEGIWDTAPIMSSLRRDNAGRLIVGTMGRVMGRGGAFSERWAAQRLKQLFPALGPVDFESAWHGKIAMTPDHLPRILRLDERVYAPMGYNGRGITTGTILGRAVANAIADNTEAALPIPVTTPKTIPAGALMTPLYKAAFAVNQARALVGIPGYRQRRS